MLESILPWMSNNIIYVHARYTISAYTYILNTLVDFAKIKPF